MFETNKNSFIYKKWLRLASNSIDISLIEMYASSHRIFNLVAAKNRIPDSLNMFIVIFGKPDDKNENRWVQRSHLIN